MAKAMKAMKAAMKPAMKPAMKAAPRAAMKAVMKTAMKAKAMKAVMKPAMKAMKKKHVSIIARGRLAKVQVLKGAKQHTVGGLKASDLMKNKRGKVVSKKAHATGMKHPWMTAVKAARKALGITGFCVCGGTTPEGKALYAKAKSLVK